MLAGDLASLAGDESLFAATATEKLERLQAELQPLAERYDVVVANPPYMGSSSLGKWNGKWIKDNFPEAYRDLCTSFIDRGSSLSNNQGYSAMVTMQSWMFLGSYEKLRGKLLRNHTISSMAHLGTRAFGAIGGEVVSTTATVFANKKYDVPGTYLRLVDMGSEQEKAAGALEALANPNCGWFYRRKADVFSVIPGSPIAYWASASINKAFINGERLGNIGRTSKGLITGDNSSFLRLWWECGLRNSLFYGQSFEETLDPSYKWFACTKGGPFRRWSGNIEWLIDWSGNGRTVRDAALRDGHHSQDYADELKFKPSITWSAISSDLPSFRMARGKLSEHAGMCDFLPESKLDYVLSFINSSIAKEILKMIAPTLNFNAGDIDSLPLLFKQSCAADISSLATKCVQLSNDDWNASETSWDFMKHPLV